MTPLCKTCGGRGVVPFDLESCSSCICPDCDGTGIDFRDLESDCSRKERASRREEQDEDET